mmetsp:Transcript_6147/g.13804  ORF Transcript_6147/g.13804 Transcript_6147/m.13804 type:complete len:90 (+) Transcript_6147:342-611(+)
MSKSSSCHYCQGPGGCDIVRLVRNLRRLWKKIVYLTKAELHGNTGHVENFLLLHALVDLEWPLCIVHLSARMHPEQLVLENQHGKTPLI